MIQYIIIYTQTQNKYDHQNNLKMKTLLTKFLMVAAPALLFQSKVLAQGKSSLDSYISRGLNSNESIRQQDFLLQKNIYALQEAKSLFFPNVDFKTDYTKASGGRTINVPVGDLVNQVYSTLNTLTGTNKFPQLKNESILLNPDNFYDARFHTTMPLINAELIYNKRIKRQQVDLQKTEVVLYKRELVKDIKTAYYNYAKALNAVSIYQSSLKLVAENKRINTALFNNDKVNRTAVVRSDNEVTKISSQLIAADQDLLAARSYFNFLINSPLTDTIKVDSIAALPDGLLIRDTTVEKREELSKLKIAIALNKNATGLAKSYIIPKLGTFLDLGSQAYGWEVNSGSRYYFFGISLNWNLFASGKNTYEKKQAIVEQQSLEAQSDYVEKQLKMQLSINKNAYRSAVARYEAAQSQLKTAGQYYGDELKLYKEGQIIYIELLDAQNQLINARLEANIALFDAWGKYADIERANASFNLN